MLIDMHCDTISELLHGEKGRDLVHNDLCVSLEGMQKAGTWIQYFACFVNAGKYERELQAEQGQQGNIPPTFCPNWIRTKECMKISSEAWEMAWKEVLCLIERLRQEESEQIRIITNCQEAEGIRPQMQHLEQMGGETQFRNTGQSPAERSSGKNIIAALPTLEEGGVLNGHIERLEELYQKGIRLITLTWNYENCIGSPNSRDAAVMRQGLKPFGFEVIERMNDLGMLIDVSHLSDGGFWDCIQRSKAPIVASHSNARTLCGHPRNLSDDMLRALAEKGGVAGLNFYPAFLRRQVCDKTVQEERVICQAYDKTVRGTGLGKDDQVTTADIARHAKYMIDIAGEDVVAIGTDFDGFETDIREGYISHVGEMERVWDACKKAGITERQMDKIRWQNAWRVMKDSFSG